MTLTHHSSSVSLHKLDNTSRVLIPQVDVSTVAATDHKLTARPIEIHPLHCEKRWRRVSVAEIQNAAVKLIFVDLDIPYTSYL